MIRPRSLLVLYSMLPEYSQFSMRCDRIRTNRSVHCTGIFETKVILSLHLQVYKF
jgi:hypothetical protein